MLDKVIWLTGASSGIGEALAYELASQGAILALTSRREELLVKLVDQIKLSGGSAYTYAGDVLNLEQLKSINSKIEKEIGKIDILIANAGSHVFTNPDDFDSKEYQELMTLNYGGMLNSIEAVLPSMYQRKQGQIVGVASVAGYRGLPRAGAYGASKAAMIHFLESLRFHLKKHNITVNIICPGFVKTPLTDKNDFYMPFLVSAKKAAKIITKGISKNRKEVTFPIPFNWFMKFMRIIPYAFYEMIIFPIWKAEERARLKKAK